MDDCSACIRRQRQIDVLEEKLKEEQLKHPIAQALVGEYVKKVNKQMSELMEIIETQKGALEKWEELLGFYRYRLCDCLTNWWNWFGIGEPHVCEVCNFLERKKSEKEEGSNILSFPKKEKK